MSSYISSGWTVAHLKCPFFLGETEKTVVCEGWLPHQKTEMRMSGKHEKREFMEQWCCENYQECEVYKLVMKKYEEETP